MNLEQIERNFAATDDRRNAVGQHAMVAVAFPEAAEAASAVLESGGNAIDAACAATFVLGVCEPQGSGLGGQSMGMVTVDNRPIVIDGSTRVPLRAHPGVFDPSAEAAIGHKATTVPGTVAFWGYLNRRYGRVPWQELLQPAIDVARNGYVMTPYQRSIQVEGLKWFKKEASQTGTRAFLAADGGPVPAGTVFKQPELAATLTHLADNGPEAFYTGEIAAIIDADMRRYDGFLRADDLANIPWPVERDPIRGRFRSLDVLTTGAPTAGITLLQALALVERLSAEWGDQTTGERQRTLAELYRRLFQLREQSAYHPEHKPLDLGEALNPTMLDALADAVIGRMPATDGTSASQRSGETTHIAIIDQNGDAVSVSQSLYYMYGAFAACEELGFMYNDYLTRFEMRDPNHPYYMRPGAIPWTSIAPALFYHNSDLWLVIGTPGAERIFSAMSELLLDLFDGSHSLAHAMRKPRMHGDADGTLYVEHAATRQETVRCLERAGYPVKQYPGFDYTFGGAHAVMRCHTRPELHGAADPRRDGIAIGV